LRGFLVRQDRKFIANTKREDDRADFFVLNPRPLAGPPPFVLGAGDVSMIGQAIVAVKGWHTERFSPGVLANAPEIFDFVEPAAFQQAVQFFGKEPVLRVLVAPALPRNRAERESSVALIRGRGVDAVISFETILADLIERVEKNRNYQKSDVLQTIRVLKAHNFLKSSQLELFAGAKTRRPAKRKAAEKKPVAESAPPAAQ